jgi:aspartate kinase
VRSTGSLSAIVTNDSHTNARIIEVRPFRVLDELQRGKVVIVAGYQGVSYKKEVTTLGRGGSDTTAVALAAALDAEACEIYSDVEGVYTADPRVVPQAQRLSELSYEEMQELAEAGAKVLNAQAVEFAKERGIAIYARASHAGQGETLVRKFPPRAAGRVVGIASETGIAALSCSGGEAELRLLLDLLAKYGAPAKQLMFHAAHGRAPFTSLVLPLENLHDAAALRRDAEARLPGCLDWREGLGAVSAIGAGINAALDYLQRALGCLEAAGTSVLGVSTSSFRISLLVEQAAVKDTVQRLHRELIGNAAGGHSTNDR